MSDPSTAYKIAVAATSTKGHNRPPFEEWYREMNETLPDYLAQELAPEIERTNALVANAKNVPDVIQNDDEESKATDIVSQMKKHAKVIDGRRSALNVGPTQAKAIIDGFCKKRGIEPIDAEVARIDRPLTTYKREKAERLRREAEARAERERIEAEKRRQEAAEAERKRQEAEAARQRAEQEAKAAEEARRKAVEEARLAKERQEAAELAAKAAEAQRKAAQMRREEEERKAQDATRKREREAAETRARRAQEEEDRQARRAQEERERAEREAQERARQKEEADRQRAAQDAAEAERRTARETERETTRDSKTATSLAASSDRDAHKAERAADASQASLSGSRGDLGGQSSLRTRWVGELVDRDKLDLKKLRPFLSDEHLQVAINKYVTVHKGSQPLAGAKIYEDDSTTVR